MDAQQILVPIKVQALVIDDLVFNKRGAVEIEPKKYAANDGRWSPQVYDYNLLTATLTAPGPQPFYGARREYDGNPTENLVLNKDSPALPEKKDRGVYLHWVLPAGLRHAYTPGSLDFPALPDHWLIVRFSHQGSEFKTKAWFVDGGAVTVPGDTETANLLVAENQEYTAKRAGRVVPLEEFASANFSGERTTITALGNAHTGSPTFTAFIAENRNVFSWHDTLEDLREQKGDESVPKGTTLSYALFGWYHEPRNEPLAAPAARLVEQRDAQDKLQGWVIEPFRWFIAANSVAPADLLKRRSVFHGVVAHINYWSAETYKGPMLGFPGAPAVHETFRKPLPAFEVGVGNNAEDALVSLVSSSYSGEQEGSILAKTQPNLWKALEAVIYRQAETLVRTWNVAPLDMMVHQNWFATLDAGKFWYIRPQRENQESVFPTKPEETVAQTSIQPTPEQLAKLKELNQLQAQVDAVSRELGALQQDLYGRWWKLCAKSHKTRPNLKDEEKDCRALVKRVSVLRAKRDQLFNLLRPLPDQLNSKLTEAKLELKYDAAPRFWVPADPVIVIRNCGRPTKHQFAHQLSLRLPDQIVTHAEVVVDQQSEPFSTAAGVNEIAAAAQKHLPACPQTLTALLNEASIIEQAIRDLATRTLPPEKSFFETKKWEEWTDRLIDDLVEKPKSTPFHEIKFSAPGRLNIPAHRLVELWGQQPWSPLFIDWEITWFPTTQPPTAEHPFGPVWKLDEADFMPLDRASIPETGYTVRGRSLLSPIDERIFQEPIKTLRELLQGKDENSTFPSIVREIFSRYEIVWDKTLKQLAGAGLMGQALTGFHQALLGRDVTLPHITPDPVRPWIITRDNTLKTLENDVKVQLEEPKEALSGERLAPPAPVAAPFSLIRAGAVRIDELWLVDDFGQSADLLGLSPARSQATGQVFHPRIRWHNDQSVFAMPPRVLQPVRLNFRFTEATESPAENPALSPICGWIFFNPLDQALVLCDRHGELVGHLLITKDQRGTYVNWDAGAGGVELSSISNPTLKSFAESLIETSTTSKARLVQLLNLIDSALKRIRPAAASRETVLAGRPLTLVNATIGLELFGKPWIDPGKTVEANENVEIRNAALDALRVPVNLGYSHSIEDGLVGYYKEGAYNRIVAAQPPEASDYIRDSRTDGLRVGFGPPERLTLLMDPWGSVQAACRIVPSKTITLAQADLDKTVAHMETSFRVGPVLLQTDRLALPTPAGNRGVWNFSGPLTNQTATTVAALDPKYFSDHPVVAAEGRLSLLHEE